LDLKGTRQPQHSTTHYWLNIIKSIHQRIDFFDTKKVTNKNRSGLYRKLPHSPKAYCKQNCSFTIPRPTVSRTVPSPSQDLLSAELFLHPKTYCQQNCSFTIPRPTVSRTVPSQPQALMSAELFLNHPKTYYQQNCSFIPRPTISRTVPSPSQELLSAELFPHSPKP